MRKKGLSPFKAGVITLVVLAIAVYLGFTKTIPFVHHYTIQAVFPTANNIRKASPVRIAGVEVGKVTNVSRYQAGKPGAVVTMQINKKGLPIHKDATFKIRPRIFLEGNFFVDVQPGTPSAPTTGDGHVFPINQTATPVQLDQITTALPSYTRRDLQKLLQELSSGLNHGGAAGFNLILQTGMRVDRDQPDVPLLRNLSRSPNDKLAFDFISRTMALARPVATNDNVPPERVEALRRAFDATMKDAEFLAEARQQDLDISPWTGEELQKTVVEIVNAQPAVLEQIRKAIQSGSISEERKEPAR